MRVPFSQIFTINANGSISPKAPVRIGGVTMGPGVAFGSGVSFSGVDLSQYVGKDLEVSEEAGVYVIIGSY